MTGHFDLIPHSAWEQAVFVVLFVVFTLTLVRVIFRWATKQQMEWQAFVAKRDQEWQEWMGKVEERCLGSIVELTRIIEKLEDKLVEHDLRVDERVNTAVGRELRRQSKSDPSHGPPG